jgi:molybdate transport system substrate-binding protein
MAIGALLAGGPAPAGGDGPRRLAVAAAANLEGAIDELARGFEAEHPGVSVAVTLGASGALHAQLRNGAPFDVFLSADDDYPRRLVQAGSARPEDEAVYALGRLAIWVPPGSPLDLAGRGAGALADPAVRRLAIANPRVAPYGRAAEAALRWAGVHGAVRDRLVLGQSVAQAAQFARSGAADAAVLPRSLALSPALAGGRVLVLPEESHPPLRQAAVAIAGARAPDLARAFLRFLLGPRGREILARRGYDPP